LPFYCPIFGEHFNKDILNRLTIFREALLNPLSHFDNAHSEVYKNDIEEIFKLIKKLEQLKNDPIIAVNKPIIVEIYTVERGIFQFHSTLLDDYRLLKDLNTDSLCESHLNIQQDFMMKNISSTVHYNPKRRLRNKTLQEIYDDFCTGIINYEGQTPQRATDMLDVFINADGDTIRQLIDRMY
jgi:hypothetical protein